MLAQPAVHKTGSSSAIAAHMMVVEAKMTWPQHFARITAFEGMHTIYAGYMLLFSCWPAR